MFLSKRVKGIFRDIFMMCYHMYLMHFVYVTHKAYVTVHTLWSAKQLNYYVGWTLLNVLSSEKGKLQV